MNKIPIITDEDIALIRNSVKQLMIGEHFSLIHQTKTITAASELARNALVHGGGGVAILGKVSRGSKIGVKLTIIDHGPGIPDIEKAMEDGYSTGKGLGLGLGGAKRLTHEFYISSNPGKGTEVTIVEWR